MKKQLVLLLALSLVLILAGCNLRINFQPTNTEPATPTLTPTPELKEVSLLISTTDPLKYCNGADMDSEGFKKTLTKEITTTNLETNLSAAELIRKSIVWAAGQSGVSFPQAEQNENYLIIKDGTAYIQPTDGWAGVSIALCSWQPFLEVNLLRFPEIKKFEWVTDQAQWAELNK
jgi:hypothetical protein